MVRNSATLSVRNTTHILIILWISGFSSVITNNEEAIDYVLHECRENDVKFIRLWFTDILGGLKGFAITIEELESAMTRGMAFDGSAIEGFARTDEHDLYAVPDPNTFSILPWRPRTKAVAKMFCDIVTPSNQPFAGDPRFVLRQNLERASSMGFTYYVATELEYFYFQNSTDISTLDQGGYFDQESSDPSTDLRRETVLTLEELGIPVESSHHEVAPSQHEIDLRHTDALTMADSVMTYRHVVKEIAMSNGYYATFIPKPISGVNGSGMHTHQSLFSGDTNAFFDPNTPYLLSEIAMQFIAGQLIHSREITSVTNQWVNSYKRLVPHFEAPIYASWSIVNSSDLIRIPAYKEGREASRRIEYRAPDSACNPYLAFSVMLAAGLNGIENNHTPPPVTDHKLNPLSNHNLENSPEKLPGNLWEALQLTEKSDLVRNALGETVRNSFIENKKIEWDRYHDEVSETERQKYISVV